MLTDVLKWYSLFCLLKPTEKVFLVFFLGTILRTFPGVLIVSLFRDFLFGLPKNGLRWFSDYSKHSDTLNHCTQTVHTLYTTLLHPPSHRGMGWGYSAPHPRAYTISTLIRFTITARFTLLGSEL